MSEQEYHVGKLYKVEIDTTVEEKCKELCKLHNINDSRIDVYNNSYLELLCDMCHDKYIVLKNTLYRIEDEEFDVGYYCKMEKNMDNSISYIATFYNGGTYLKECLEDEINNI